MKVIDKTKLDPVARGHLFQEVRCMKMVQHPNVVRLYEVIDTATKLYLILELGDGGDMYDCIMKHDGGLAEEVSWQHGGHWVAQDRSFSWQVNVHPTCVSVLDLGSLCQEICKVSF